MNESLTHCEPKLSVDREPGYDIIGDTGRVCLYLFRMRIDYQNHFSFKMVPQNPCETSLMVVAATSSVAMEHREDQVAVIDSVDTFALTYGHHTYILASDLVLVIPRCPSCNSRKTGHKVEQ